MKVMVRSTKPRLSQRASRLTPSLKNQHLLRSRPTITSNPPQNSSSNSLKRIITLTIKQLLRNSSSNNNRNMSLRKIKVRFLPISLLQSKKPKKLLQPSPRPLTV